MELTSGIEGPAALEAELAQGHSQKVYVGYKKFGGVLSKSCI